MVVIMSVVNLWTFSVVSLILLTLEILSGVRSTTARYAIVTSSTKDTIYTSKLSDNDTDYSAFYPNLDWLGQPLNQVCAGLDENPNNLLLITSPSSCITPRLASTLERPILLLDPEYEVEGCLETFAALDINTINGTEFLNKTDVKVPSNIIPFHLHGYNPSTLISSLVVDHFRWTNALTVHVCDRHSYCGRSVLSDAVEKIHDTLTTSLLCWMSIVNQTDFQDGFEACLKMLAPLDSHDRRILIVVNTNISLVQLAISTMGLKKALNFWTRIVFLIPPNYLLSDMDFLQMKDLDHIRVVRWQGEDWLASVTQSSISRYLTFWHYPPQFDQRSDLAGILTTISATPYFSRMINTAEDARSSEAASSSLFSACSSTDVKNDDASRLPMWQELSQALSCEANVGLEVCSSYSISKYEVNPVDDSPRSQTMASWSSVTGYRKFNLSDVSNLRGRKLRIAVAESAPFLLRNQTAFDLTDGNDTSRLYQGIIPNMIRTLSVVLNFRYELVFAKPGDDYYGVVEKNGKWNGMMGMLQRGEVDLIAADLTVSLERQQAVDFTVPFYEDSVTILLPKSRFDKSLFQFLFPFSRNVWFCVIAAVGASGPLLYCLSKATPYYRAKKTVNHFASLSEAYIYCYGSIVSQGGQITPDADSSRIFMVFWWLFSICTVATYSGNLIAFLTFPGKPSSVSNLHAFLYERDMQPMIIRNSYTDKALSTSKVPDFVEAWRRIQNNDALRRDSYQEVLNVITQHDTYGCIGGLANMLSTMAQDSAKEGDCHFTLMVHPMEKVNYAWAFPKGTNYPPLFDKWIRRMTYSGLITHWAYEEWEEQRKHKPPRCQQGLVQRAEEVRNVRLADVLGVYLCLAVGYGLACIIFLGEMMARCPGKIGQCCHKFFGEKPEKFDNDSMSDIPKDSFDAPIQLKVIKLNNGKLLHPV